MFKGSMVALVTPMTEQHDIDIAALDSLLEWHLSEGTDALVMLGSTGEMAALSLDEYARVLSRAVEVVKGRLPIIAGTGLQATAHTIERTRMAMELGANSALVVTPFYNKPTQTGLLLHYEALAKAVPLPLILYNVPARTAVDLLPETVAKLAAVPNIVGIKEASGDLARYDKLLAQCGDLIAVYGGDDETACALMLKGGRGTISVAANLMPKAIHEITRAAMAGDEALAYRLNDRLVPLYKVLFLESNPIPVKWALAKMGRVGNGIRLPLTPLSENYAGMLDNALIEAGCL